MQLLDHSPLVIIPLLVSSARSPQEHGGYCAWAFWAERLSALMLIPPAHLRDLVFFAPLQQAPHHAYHYGRLMRSEHVKDDQKAQARHADPAHNLLFGDRFGGRCQSHNHPLYCGPTQWSRICERILHRFLIFISAASWHKISLDQAAKVGMFSVALTPTQKSYL